MIKYIYVCYKCKIEKQGKDANFGLPRGWIQGYVKGSHLCTKCKPKKEKIRYVSPNENSDLGVGSLYGRT